MIPARLLLVENDPGLRSMLTELLTDNGYAVDAAADLGKPFDIDELFAIWFLEAGSEIVVDTYVHYLRRKLGRDIVATVGGRGYQLGHR